MANSSRLQGLVPLAVIGLAACGGTETLAPVPIDAPFASIHAGFLHTCGVTTSGDLFCWGLGLSGQRGDGTTTYIVSSPALVVEAR